MSEFMTNAELRIYAEQLEAENNKLRELLTDCVLMPDAYGEKYGLEPNFIVCSNHWGDRVRAMGIEV